MFKVLKWAYDMGVRQERVRIAAQLQMRVSALHYERESDLDVLRDANVLRSTERTPSKSTKEKLKFQIAVNGQVKSIINEMFTPKGEWINDESIMFPNDKEK